jgi:ribonuclease BN (tRNA processing enzyme)
VLTHFSPKINDPAEWLDAARDIFPKSDVAVGGYTLTLKFSDE